jgi:hypothetical protein
VSCLGIQIYSIKLFLKCQVVISKDEEEGIEPREEQTVSNALLLLSISYLVCSHESLFIMMVYIFQKCY